mgnify:CR=1 FL=1
MKQVQVNSFTAVAPIATNLFNTLRHERLPFKFKNLELSNERDEVIVINQDERALLAALNLVLNNGGTTDAWLGAALSTSLETKVSEKKAIRINRFLIEHNVISRRSSTQQTLLNGRVMTTKIWELTAELGTTVAIAKHQSVAKFEPRQDVDVDIFKRAKGKSKGAQLNDQALYLLDSTPLMLHEDILKMAKSFLRGLKAETVEEEEAKEREALAVARFARDQKQDEFFLTHTQDFRGRINARGGYISTQASKLQKAGIIFADAEEEMDVEEFNIYLGRLAGCKGLNKEAEETGATIARRWYQEEKPAGNLESQSLLTNPTHAVIRLDGCSNGIQWMSAFLGDKSGKKLTNLTGSKPKDLYTKLKTKLRFKTRDEAKFFVMPYSYGATVGTLATQLNATRKQVYQLINTINKVLPVGKYLTHIRREVEFTEGSISWELPDGFRAVQDYKTGETISAGTFTALVGELESDTVKRALALAPNIIHSIDAYHMRCIIRECDFPVITIHDSVGCHSSNVKKLRKIILRTFKEIINSDLLNDIMRQIGFEQFDKPDASDISNPYMFM